MPERTPSHHVIVGGGAGGLELAIRLKREAGRRARVTLVDRSPAHIWKPRLHEIATGLLVPSEEEAGYAEQAARHGFDFVLGEMCALDRDARTITVAPVPYPEDRIARTAGGDLLPERRLDYDVAVLAMGSTINEFGTPGVREHCYSLDTPSEAVRLHRAFMALAARVGAGEQERIGVAIVGAGTTGVELAAELASAARHLGQYRSLIDRDQLRITVVEMADRPLPSTTTETSDYARDVLSRAGVKMRFGAKVAKVDRNAIEIEGGERIEADLLVWASGVRAHAVVHKVPGAVIEKDDRLRCDPLLRVAREGGEPDDTLYAIGDSAACFEEGSDKPVPATAQAAHQEAVHLARMLARRLRGRAPEPFRYDYKGTLVSLGTGAAVGDVPTRRTPLMITGAAPKIAYVALYRGHLATVFGWMRMGLMTASGLLRRSAMPRVKLHW